MQDQCGCYTCAKQAGETCGGTGDIEGFCGKRLRCAFPPQDTQAVQPGICVLGNIPYS